MSLDVSTPDPPIVSDRTAGDTYHDPDRRAEIQAFFGLENAWGEAFEEWTKVTSLTPDEYAIVVDLDLLAGFDFYWNVDFEHVEYEVPPVGDGRDETAHSMLASSETVADIQDALEDLGQAVADTLTEYYIDTEPTDDPDSPYHRLFGEQFNGADDDRPENES